MRIFGLLVLLLAAPLVTASGDDATESMLTDLEAGLQNLEAEAAKPPASRKPRGSS